MNNDKFSLVGVHIQLNAFLACFGNSAFKWTYFAGLRVPNLGFTGARKRSRYVLRLVAFVKEEI